MDGARHSVDIPISRTLVALRRVRSLRDPSTNSMNKFSSLFDNVKWETNSSNGCHETGSELNVDKSITCWNADQVENIASPVRNRQVFEDFHKKELMGFKDRSMNLTSMNPSCNPIDECNGPIGGSSLMERVSHCVSKQKPQSWNQVKLYGVYGDVASPCPSVDVSNHHTALYTDEDIELADDSNHQGCGISCCWSKGSRLGESNPSSNFEDLPLLSGDTSEATLCGKSFWKGINGDFNSYSNTPRSLSQKFRPKSFDELVGQKVVVRSLLSAISKGRVTSFYLFHGPRGTGKTTASRIFAAALNCLSLGDNKPCGRCRECILFFSGRSKDVKEVDSLKINRVDRLRSLVKSAAVPPVSSQFKIFIIDECQLLQCETWVTVLNSLEKLSQHIVFVMTTPELDMLPRSAVSWSQRYHFPRIKDSDISNRIEKICVEEGIEYDQCALDFIAAKSNGSLRDAEMMLDQLSLLGKKITKSLTYELIGTVSDEELLDLLEVALSRDTSNTVIRARELMRSKIDPMRLISHLANLITDILSGKCEEDGTEARREFSSKHNCDADLQKLSHALRTLSKTEKRLRVSKNQTTWLTVALLQLSSVDSNSLELNDSKLCLENAQRNEGDSNSTTSTWERSNHPISCMWNGNNSSKLGKQDDSGSTLESIWKRATELCQSGSFKKFLRKHGRLTSLCINQGMAFAELEFNNPNHVSRAENSWKHIASSLQLIVGCNVEIRINLPDISAVSKYAKLRKLSFSLFSCSRRLHPKSRSSTNSGSESDVSKYTCEKPMISSRGREVVTGFRNSDGNISSTGANPSGGLLQDDTSSMAACGVYSSKTEGRDYECCVLSVQEPDSKVNCFPRALRRKKVCLSEGATMISSSNQEENKLALSIPGVSSFENPLCSNDYCSDNENRLRENSEVYCWRNPTFPSKKALQQPQRRQAHLTDWVLPCSTAK